MTENPYAVTNAAGTRPFPSAFERSARAIYVVAWIAVVLFRWTQELQIASPDHNKAFYDSMWMGTAVAVIVINLYAYYYTRWRLLLANLSLRMLYQGYTIAFIAGLHHDLPSSVFHSVTSLLWPIVILRLRTGRPIYTWSLRFDAVILLIEAALEAALELRDEREPGLLIVYGIIRLFTSTVHPILLAFYSFPKNYPRTRPAEAESGEKSPPGSAAS